MTTAAEFTRSLEAASQAKTPEERIALLEAALQLEPKLLEWSLRGSRADVKAALYAELGFAYQQSRDGDRADNMERAIAALEAVLNLLTLDAPPRERADAHHNLAVAYSSRIRGTQAANIEQGIAHVEAALEVFTRDAAPVDWARAQIVLGVAYDRRKLGVRSENVAKAISAYQAALSILTREGSPQDWAGAQKNLAMAYANHLEGNIAHNFENAILAFNAALTVFTRDAFPKLWSEIQGMLATVRANLADFHAATHQTRDELKDFQEAISLALDPAGRRRFLTQLVATLPEYSAARIERYWAPLREMLDEMEMMRRKGIPETDPALWEASLLRVKASYEFVSSNIEQDQKKNSGAFARHVLEAHLQTGTPFVLLLRAFSLEARRLQEDDELAKRFPGYEAQSVRGPWSNRAIDQLATAIHPQFPALMIANNDDHWPPEGIPKFYVSAAEWRKLAFSLAAQAGAIVLLLPRRVTRITGGVLEEIQAADLLKASGKTIAIVESDEEGSGPDSFDIVRAELEKWRFRLVWKAEDLTAAPETLLAEIRVLLGDRR